MFLKRLFYIFLRQLGGELVRDGEALPGDNLDKVAQVLEIMRHWAEEGWQPEQTEVAASIVLFATGKSVFFLSGVWEVPTFADMEKNDTLGFEWTATQMPTILGQQIVASVTIWWTNDFNVLLFISGLRNIPKDYYEAAGLDGASRWQLFGKITWPLLWPVAVAYLIFQRKVTQAVMISSGIKG